MASQVKALFDVSVVIAALTGEEESVRDAKAAVSLSAQGRIEGYLSAAAIEGLNDALARTQGGSLARNTLQELRTVLDIAPVDNSVVDAAIALDWPYFDDALTHECARLNGIERLVTLNPTDFDSTALRVQAPSELLRDITPAFGTAS